MLIMTSIRVALVDLLLFAEWLDTHIEQVGHLQFVFTIPKLLRPIFKYHPKDLGLLCKATWQSLKEMFQEAASDHSALPGVVISAQSYGDSLNLHPHIHRSSRSSTFSLELDRNATAISVGRARCFRW
jgi:hypothetical protein